jgi:hypothetical protein
MNDAVASIDDVRLDDFGIVVVRIARPDLKRPTGTAVTNGT